MTEDERLSAYLDGQLSDADMEALDAELSRDPKLAERLATLAASDDMLRKNFGAFLAQPVPDRLTSLLEAPKVAEIIDFAAAKTKFHSRRALTGWTGLRAFGAIAATLVVGFVAASQFGGQKKPSPDQIAFHQALESAPSGQAVQLAAQGRFMPRLSFIAGDGRYCREYALAGRRGIACKDGEGWVVEADVKGGSAESGDGYAIAGGNDALDGVYARLGAGNPLTKDQERQAISSRWEKFER